MAQTLPNQYRRELFADRSSANYQVPEESLDPVELDKKNQSEQYRRRLLDRFRKTDDPKMLEDYAKRQLREQVEKQVTSFFAKNSLKIFKIACGATVILLIVTCLTWIIQAIFGNLLGNKFLKLGGFELGLGLVVIFIVLALIIMIIAFLALGVRMLGDPLFMVKELWDALTNMFQSLLQNDK